MKKTLFNRVAAIVISIFLIFVGGAAIAADVDDGDNLQDAIDAALSGATITVGAGTYAPIIISSKYVILQGAHSGNDACDRDGTEESVITGAGILLKLEGGSAGTIIDGFTFSGSSKQLESTSGPIDTVQILNNRFIGFSSSAIFLNDNGVDITVHQNSVDGSSSTGGGVIHLDTDNFDGFRLTDNCVINATNGFGFFVDGNRNVGMSTREPLIDGNLFSNNQQSVNIGSRAFESGYIRDNTFKDNSYDGLLGGPKDTMITGNDFINNGRFGIALTSFGNTNIDRGAQNNTITNNCFSGNGFTHNVLYDAAGLFFSSSQATGTISTNYFYNNNFSGNYAGAFYGGTETINGEDNWWGAADGPAGDGTGSGDVIDGESGGGAIDFDPFLTAIAQNTPCTPTDNEGPITSNVGAVFNPAAAGSQTTISALVDDSTTGNSTIKSADWTILDSDDAVIAAGTMAATDGAFDEITEDVTATITAPAEAGIYSLCINGTDALDNVGDDECIMFVVYDPDGGFVTGGGWIDSPAGAYMPNDASVVTPANVNVDWFSPDLRGGGYVDFIEGPSTPPLGIGSLEMGTTASVDKAQLFNYDHGLLGNQVALADIDSITYATYRDSSSTNSLVQYPAINIEVDYVGDGSSYTTLVWEPIYAYGQGNLAVDTWQIWDTFAASQTGFGGGWWSTKDIPGVCAFNCFVDWNTIITNNPNAKIKYAFGVNVGSGWTDVFTGSVDALSLTVDGNAFVYDFEPFAPFDPSGKASFGFVSKYNKKTKLPEGNTEFVFQAADLNFHSSSYEWLVVTGSDYARFKGTGTINGEGDYKFMLWAGDDEPDTFRIKIWEEDEYDTETVIYDNGMDQAIAGGSIVIHTKKK